MHGRVSRLDTRPDAAKSRGFSAIHRNAVVRRDFLRVLHERHALEGWLLERFTSASALEVVAFLVEHSRFSGAVRDTSPSHLRPLVARRRDLEFHATFRPSVPLDAFLANRSRWKAETITRPRAGFLGARHVFVVGVGRSGTRWAVQIADEILGAKDEPHVVSRAIREDTTSFTAHLRQRTRRHHLEADEDALIALVEREPFLLAQLMCGAADVLVAKVDPGLALQLRAFTGATSIFITRDPRNIVLSQRAFFLTEPRRDVLSDVAWTVGELEACAEIAASLGAFTVRYEDLLSAPHASVGALAAAIGRPLDAPALEAVVERVSFASMTQGRTYGERRDGEYFRGGSSFRDEFTNEEKARVAERYGARLQRLGYEG